MDEISIGVLSIIAGPYEVMGKDGLRGVDLAVEEFGGQVAGKTIRLVKQGSNAIPDTAVMMASHMLHKDRVDFVIAPLSGNEGLAMRDFAKTMPDRAFINGIAGAQDITLRDPAPNFFSFFTNGVQWMSGVAEYVYRERGYRRIATLAEDYSYPHSQIGAFTLEFCQLGGKIVDKLWVSLGTMNYSTIINQIPQDIDALFCALGGSDAVNFLSQYGSSIPLIGGTITADQTIFNMPNLHLDSLIGAVSGGPIADDNPTPSWQAFVNAYRQRFPRALNTPSLSAFGYYVNTKAALLALQACNGDLSNNHRRFMAALRDLEFETPSGKVRLDHNRQAVAHNFVTEVRRDNNGKLYNALLRDVPNVRQTLGFPEDDYLSLGGFTRDNPAVCP